MLDDLEDAEMKRNQKGFTLVEVIVVLVILAILAAILVPSLTGYIAKAKDKVAVAECRACVQAAQTILTESYAKNSGSPAVDTGAAQTLAEVDGTITAVSFSDSAKLEHLSYTSKDDIVVVYCAQAGEDGCGNSETFTVDGVLASGNGLIYTAGNERPNEAFQASIESIAAIEPSIWNKKSSIDSTAGESGAVKKALLEKMSEGGINLTDDNIKSWAVRPSEGGGVEEPVLWWSDQDISQYKVGDQVRVIRYNGAKNTYTAGYMVLDKKEVEKNGKVIDTYNIFRGGVGPGWTEYTSETLNKQTDESKASYEETLKYYNEMDPQKQ